MEARNRVKDITPQVLVSNNLAPRLIIIKPLPPTTPSAPSARDREIKRLKLWVVSLLYGLRLWTCLDVGETSASSGLPQTTLKSPDEKGVDDDYYYRKSGTRTITDIQPSLSPVSIVSTLGCLVTTLYERLGSYT